MHQDCDTRRVIAHSKLNYILKYIQEKVCKIEAVRSGSRGSIKSFLTQYRSVSLILPSHLLNVIDFINKILHAGSFRFRHN